MQVFYIDYTTQHCTCWWEKSSHLHPWRHADFFLLYSLYPCLNVLWLITTCFLFDSTAGPNSCPCLQGTPWKGNAPMGKESGTRQVSIPRGDERLRSGRRPLWRWWKEKSQEGKLPMIPQVSITKHLFHLINDLAYRTRMHPNETWVHTSSSPSTSDLA